MATRSLTDIFVLMRTNSIQSRGIYSFKSSKHNEYDSENEDDVDDKVALMETGSSKWNKTNSSELRSQQKSPPSWAGSLEEAQYSITRLQNKLKEVQSLQDAQVLRPTLDDSSLQEKHIQDLTLDITRIFGSTKKIIQQIRLHSNGLSGNKESQLSFNVSSALVSSLQILFNEFRNSQQNYLNKIKRREAMSSQMFFETEDNTNSSDLLDMFDTGSTNSYGQQLQMQQSNQTQTFAAILIEEENAKIAAQWEKEANQITSSVVELNNIFKDLAHMVVQQGTVLDRIDYNIEQTEMRVRKGASELIKAEKYHRSNRKMKCILILAPITIVLLILLDITKF
ncbi:syntaxin-16 [Adelges cooleyi]|uniref:syntaxin-16 n=1 Tax=Adelges cooleyi TaxID=133065 RepID=UPI00217F9EB3|nr:syntaxin-16 [Adelges cooleyi]XP_050428778.1 syntaxin-16 [Adelges cooleyi]